MRVSILTLGCKTNQAESASLEAGLRTMGWSIVDLKEKPDICVINTCSVTARTDYESRQLIRRAHNAGSRVIVTGCYSELNRDFVRSMEGVDQVVSNSKKAGLSHMLAGHPSGNGLGSSVSGKSRLFVKVQDGCNGKCSYCIIPMARGKSRSVETDSIVRQIDAASAIYNEVVLTAIHLGTYGYDLGPNVTLSYLIRQCLRNTSIGRIRLSSLEVNEVDEELLGLIQDERICKHLHIPLQSGDNRILEAMSRNYGRELYSEKILNIQKVIPSVSIGTDVIVGFPGESDREFQRTYDLIESLPVSYIHVFPFSARPGTRASQLKERVDPAVTKERCASMRSLSQRKRSVYMKEQVGERVDLIVEKVDGDRSVVGITGNYLRVRALDSDATPRDLVPVRLAGIENDLLFAYPI